MTYREALEDNMRRFLRDHSAKREYIGRKVHEKHETHEKQERHEKTEAQDTEAAGRIIHISLPAGTEVELLELIEFVSPGGINIDAKLPFLSGLGAETILSSALSGVIESIKKAGGSIEII